jgi:hypothetical protein
VPAPSGVFCQYLSVTPTKPGDAPNQIQIFLQLCRCNANSAEFDAWAAKPEVLGDLVAGTSPQLISAVGERAYLLPSGRGVAFRQNGVDFILKVGGGLAQFRETSGPISQVSGRRPLLPAAELDAKATTLFSALAMKILGRLAAAPPAAPAVVSCGAGAPTVTLPANFAFSECREDATSTNYVWCPTTGGGCLNLTRRPFGPNSLSGDVVDINGRPGAVQKGNDTTSVGWYDSSLSWTLHFSGSLLSRDALLAFARSVRPVLVATPTLFPIVPAGASPARITGRCTTPPTVTLPSGFVFGSCKEEGIQVTFKWATAQGGGALTLGSIPLTNRFGNPGGSPVDINGHYGVIAAQGNDTWLMIWSDGTANFYLSAVGLSQDAFMAFARSIH